MKPPTALDCLDQLLLNLKQTRERLSGLTISQWSAFTLWTINRRCASTDKYPFYVIEGAD